MAGTGGASSMAENQGRSCDSESGNKKIKSGEEEEDRLSALPDFLIQHILCLLPAIDLVKTSVLSKWWKNQWTLVPVLKFISKKGMSSNIFSNFIDKTLILHNSPNLDKFVIDICSFPSDEEFPNLDLWIGFSVRKIVKELIVDFNSTTDHYSLPEFLFNNCSLVKLKLCCCDFMPTEKVNWGSLKSLLLDDCELEVLGIENVLSGSPQLEYFELRHCEVFGYDLVIVCKSLKTLVLDEIGISCDDIEISCPNLERLRISNLVWFKSLKFMNLPSSVYATLDFFFDIESEGEEGDDMSPDQCLNLVQQILRQVEHVEKLEIGGWIMEILSNSKEEGDCIGGLPDSFIHRIISFKPSTKDAFKTDRYKTWRHDWTDVPILNFVSNEKFFINSKDIPLVDLDPRLSLWIRFAARKDVKELFLECNCTNLKYEYPFPQFVFNNSSLVKLEICACTFMPNGNVNWESLKSLQLNSCSLDNQAIRKVLSGSPSLECLELDYCDIEDAIVVASEHLKTFILVEFHTNCHLVEVSCPNLESLKIMRYLGSTALKLTNLPYSLHAKIDFYILKSDDTSPEDCMKLVEENVKPILQVQDLKFELSRLR